ncbi:M48 family metallopeptidase [Croceicoccus sp. Ery5]|uniref:tetratricopeptide repeat protein n=1 Tax=Croceicoccus sp. Ery5 TaxID=1703340 RepID=UPI001E30FFD7|nr:hypothetical protein [Croceicoccus sp. Ery5]
MAAVASCMMAAVVSVPIVLFTMPNVVPGAIRAQLVSLPLVVSPEARAAAAAIALATDQSEETLDKAERWANEAVLADPLEESAIRSLSFVNAYRGKNDKAMAILRYGESLSKRDLMTELALALDARQSGDNEQSIRHYGHALGTTIRGYDLIVEQVLANTSQDVEFARDLGTAMAARPGWRDRFLPFYIARTQNPDALGATIGAMWVDGVPQEDRALASRALTQMLRLGSTDNAARLIGRVAGPGGAARVRDGGFEDGPNVPLGWDIERSASFSGLAVPKEGDDGKVLELGASSGHAGAVASQILALAPGNYRLSGSLWAESNADSGMPRLQIRCVGGSDPIVELRKAEGAHSVADARPISTPFTVPDNCTVQYIEVRFGSSLFVSRSRGWVDDISVDPL